MSPQPRKILLGEDELPSAWFNIVPSMPTKPDPYLHPQTREPVGPDALAPLFPMALIGQEVSTDEWVDIPGPVLDTYKLWRPTPLIRALDLERALEVEREAAIRLRALDEMKDTFLQAVSHDLRTPLAAILGLATTLPARPRTSRGSPWR